MKVCKSYLLYAAILAFIGGCTPSTNTPIKAPPAIVQAPLIDHPVTGDTRRAEQLYRSAQSAGEATRNSILLDSAGLFYRNGNLLRSRNVFAEIDPQRLLDSEYFEYSYPPRRTIEAPRGLGGIENLAGRCRAGLY